MGLTEILPDEYIPEEEIKPGIKELPFLPYDYPEFSWNDWPESRIALTPGFPTKYFSREVWNEIVLSIYDVLCMADSRWFDPRLDENGDYCTYEKSLMTKPYSQLTATMFNTVCNNIDIGTPDYWPWAKDKNYHGYVGKNRFKGTTITYNDEGQIIDVKHGDKVYANYILEVARKLNLMIGLGKGTVPTVDVEAPYISRIWYFKETLQKMPSVRAYAYHNAWSIVEWLDLYYLEAKNVIIHGKSKIKAHNRFELLHAAGIDKLITLSTNIFAAGRVRNAQKTGYAFKLSTTKGFTGIINEKPSAISAFANSSHLESVSIEFITGNFLCASENTTSNVDVKIKNVLLSIFNAERLSDTSAEISIVEIKRQPFDGYYASRTESTASAALSEFVTLFAEHVFYSNVKKVPLHEAMPLSFSASNESYSSVDLTIENTQISFVNPEHISCSSGDVNVTEIKSEPLSNRFSSKTSASIEFLLMVVRERYMHTVFKCMVFGLAKSERVKNILLWYDDLLLSRGNGAIENFAQRLLHDVEYWLKCGNVQNMQPTIQSLYLSDWNLNTANRKIEKPEQIQLVFRDSDVFTASQEIQKLTAIYLNAKDHLLYSIAANIEHPDEIYVHLFDPRTNATIAKIEGAVENYLYSLNFFFVHSGSKLEIPKKVCLSISRFMLSEVGWRTQMPSEYYCNRINKLFGNAGFQNDIPSDMQLYVIDFRLSIAAGNLEDPTSHFVFSEQDAFGFTSVKRQNPISLYLYNRNRLIYSVCADIETPSLWYLFNKNRLVYSVCADVEVPTKHKAFWLENILRCAGANIHKPDSIYLNFLSAGVSSKISYELKEPSETCLNAINATLPSVDAKCQEPEGIMACIVASDVFVANVDRRNLLAIYIGTAGNAKFFVIGFFNPTMQEPTMIWGIAELPGVSGHVAASLLDIAFGAGITTIPGISGYAGGELLDSVATAGTAYLGHLYGIAGHAILRLLASAGIAHLPNLYGYSDPHTASAVASAGRTIELEFSCTFLCSYTLGRDFNLRMHIEIEPAQGILYGFVADTLPTAGTATLPAITGSMEYFFESPENASLSCASGSVYALNASTQIQIPETVEAKTNIGCAGGCAGAITWSHNVQRGSTLYIRQTQEADLIDGVLILH